MKTDRSQVLLKDECRFSLKCDTRRVLAWRGRGARNKTRFVQGRSHYSLRGLMVWVGISIGGRNDLHIILNSDLTAQRYTDGILRSHIVYYAAAIGDFVLLMQETLYSSTDVELS
ncbi:transposable element Tcb2 transposase [Trichonephila clavipes]|uniref:Transposable element Tcb2 transposase n=1 Tax=Trichonephila clavipes TaxID=2585209 RepID=A0A8X6RVL2_TRICX|nr:transposable element Tcb2 transposase [Trichonephila clavipes]